MISFTAATDVVHMNYPGGTIQNAVEYKDLYLFIVFNKMPGEEEWDPFFSVNKETGEFKEFSILTDGDTDEILALFSDEEVT